MMTPAACVGRGVRHNELEDDPLGAAVAHYRVAEAVVENEGFALAPRARLVRHGERGAGPAVLAERHDETQVQLELRVGLPEVGPQTTFLGGKCFTL